MRVVLVNPPDITVAKKTSSKEGKTVKGRFSKREPPLGLAYIASALEKAQHEVYIIDCMGSELDWGQICETLEKSNPDLIGITTLTATLQSAFEVARKSKEFYPEVPVVLGGHGTFMIEETILRRIKSVDIIVRGEGEETIVELADVIEGGQSLKGVLGVCFKHNKHDVIINPPRPFIQNLDLLPFPARHLLPMESYINDQLPRVLGRESFKGTPLVSSRGCSFSCVFCAATRFYGHMWRPRSAENVIDEIEHLYQNYKKLGLGGFNFADDNFLADPHRVMKICDLLLDRGLSHLRWICEARVDSANERLYSKMYEAGCRVLAFGIESGNDMILRKIRKGITTDMVRRAVKISKAVGLKIWGYFLLGLPGDTKETIRDTIDFAEELDLDITAFHPVFMYPGTEMGKEQNVDWLNFLIEEELFTNVAHQTCFHGFHPCVPTYANRDEMKALMRYVTKQVAHAKARKKNILKLLLQGLAYPRKAAKFFFNRVSSEEKPRK
jgi:radical SAM superfamily enzyme YgiQ (UPF0313 family)